MKKVLVISLILVVIVAIIFSIFYFYQHGDIKIINPSGSQNNSVTGSSNQSTAPNLSNGNLPAMENQTSARSAGSGSGGSSSSGGSQTDNQSPQNQENTSLPDFESYDCGFYFQGYGVCSGKCPAGNCVLEGRSCYCRLG